MDSFKLKLLACLFMFIDHAGFILFPKMIILRLIGRMAFPLFAWFISEGYIHTGNFKKYILRLSIFAIALESPFILFSSYFQSAGIDTLNIFFTLSLGLLSIYAYDKAENNLSKVLFPAIIALSAQLIKADYGFYGVITILLFYIFNNNFFKTALYQIIFNLIYAGALISYNLINNTAIDSFVILQMYSLFSLLFIKLYNKKQGKKMKYFFYIFYPAHIILLYLISEL
ncbi:TraX family protein [Clostridium sp. JN-9]|uniref:TraX family protein n=1 Tax=Clostridium sp. JN-9 TaxID=2507159 RepID=UPI000FFE30BA|nr:TraX family protein [Clostridium sp. JN-9]QAT40398.1 conjugal transfer protein TraX [Clostridium sp. JN-9]